VLSFPHIKGGGICLLHAHAADHFTDELVLVAHICDWMCGMGECKLNSWASPS